MRFLVAGGMNAVFSYTVSCLLYYTFHEYAHIAIIVSASALLAILFSFLTYRLFVFQSKGAFFKELLRCYIVYAWTLAILVCGMWLLVDFFNISFWLAQLLLLVFIIIFSYLGHSRFTFADKSQKPQEGK